MSLLIVVAAAVAPGASRHPAVAGAFYTADPVRLQREVDHLMAASAAHRDPAVALVVPHAGYPYSGSIAAKAFARLFAAEVDRVVLLGPSHHMGFGGGALPDRRLTSFATPLGEVALDREAIERLRKSKVFAGPVAAHDSEHSLEVELPFLQRVAPGARLVPILVGFDTDREQCRAMAKALAEILDQSTVVVVSSDFTHHGNRYRYAPFAGDERLGDRLLQLGRATAERLAAVDGDGFWYQVEVSGDTVCGRRPLTVLVELLEHAFEGSGAVLDVTTSGHVTGDWDLSVTYAAVAYQGSWQKWRDTTRSAPDLEELTGDHRAELLHLARATLASHINHDAQLADWFAGSTIGAQGRARAGAFVTLHNVGERAKRLGRLRACMGVIEARQPLVEAVIRAAVSAAHDPRFPELATSELDQVELEISVLSPPRRVDGPSQIRVGEHGVVLEKDGHGAVFLPQVATEQGWDRDTMLEHLARKAGLPRDAWRHGATFEVFTAQVFAEGS